MTPSQKIQIRLSECRQRLNELLGVETRSEDEQGELERLTGEVGKLEPELRAAFAAEPDAEIRQSAGGEGAELRSLQGRAELRNALAAVAGGEVIAGAERELAEARGLKDPNAVPWDLLAPRGEAGEVRGAARGVEDRADAATTDTGDINGVNQQTILQRVFARSATRTLGVSMQSVGVGEANYPVLTSGANAAFTAADGAKEAEAAMFTPVTLEPKRLQARYALRREDLARITGYEPAMRRDLGGTLGDKLDEQTLAGDGSDPNLAGFLAAAASNGLADVADPGAVVDFPGAAAVLAAGVDGKFAGSEKECSAVIGTATYAKLAALFQTGSGTAATAYAMKLLRGFQASSNVPAMDAGTKVQQGILARMGPIDQQNAVCPVWQGVTILRDEVTAAAKGWIILTAVALYGFRVLRAEGYLRLKYKLAA